MKQNDARTVTIGGALSRRVTGVSADMTWLGDPPTSEAARRYEVIRAGRHAAALALERATLEARATELAASIDSFRDKGRAVAELNRIHTQLYARCGCEICTAKP